MKRCGGLSLDIISNLPDNVIEHILSCLPLRDAIRTSILSTKWKDKWVTLPHLVFNEDTFVVTSVDPQPPLIRDEVDVFLVISQVLSQHKSPILKFVLSVSQLRSCLIIDHLLSFLPRDGIEDFTLEILTAQFHKMPSTFFSFQSLRRLRLINCIVIPPPTFSGLKNLTRIDFKRVSCSGSSLENLIANCPFLEDLKLWDILDLHSLAINAPNLVGLWFVGDDDSLLSINAPHLSLLSLLTKRRSGLSDHDEHNRSSNLVNLLCCLPQTIKQLQLNADTSHFLQVGNIPKNLSITISGLLEIVLSKFSFENLDSVACAVYFIKNAPKLVEILIYVKTSSSPPTDIESVVTFMKANLDSSVNLSCLLAFTITSFGGTEPEMELIKFVLARAPVLRKMTIKPKRAHPSYDGFMTLKKLLRFSRASSAQIIYADDE